MSYSLRAMIYALAGLSLASCASNEVRVDQVQDATAACRTFDWHRESNAPDSLTEQRVREEAFRTLERKGYTRATERPDCKITYTFSSHERARSKPRVGVGVGGGSGGIGGGVGVSIPVPGGNKNSGEFSLAIINAATNSEIWNGSVDASSKEAELTSEEAARLVEQVLAKFPSREDKSAS